MMAASTTFPELRGEIVTRMEPWVQLTEDAVRRQLAGSPLEQLMPARDIAYAIVSLYLGLEMLANLSDNREQAAALFATGERFAVLLDSLSGVAAPK